MRRTSYMFLVLLGVMLGTSAELHAQLNYVFNAGTGSQITGSFNTLWQGTRAGANGWGQGNPHNEALVNIGFTFNYNGTSYTQVTIGTAGLIKFGSASAATAGNGFSSMGGPGIAPFWDDMRLTDGEAGFGSCYSSAVRYMTTGSSPNRIFVVWYDQIGLGQGGTGYLSEVSVQARLYEGTNKIEFYYIEPIDGTGNTCSGWGGSGTQSSASIGLGWNNSTFLSVTPGSPASASTTTANNSVNVSSTSIQAGTLYTFCPGGVLGDVVQGGTSTMKDGDTLLVGRQVVLSSTQTFQPFRFFNQCATTFKYTIGGGAAGDYSITPATGSFGVNGSTPTLSFRPTTLGPRYATLKVEDNSGQVVRTYILAGQGIPRVLWTGNIAQGGTPGVANGDTLFLGIRQPNNTVQTYTPLTLTLPNVPGPPASITYTLIDPTGQFRIDRTSDNIPLGGSVSPVITFAPDARVNIQEATLIVNAEGEVRRYLLQIFSSGAGATFAVGGEPLGAGATVFRSVFKCVALETEVLEVTVKSIGDEPFLIESNDAFLVDAAIRQGTPPYPLFRDNFGNPISAPDYFVSDASGNPLQLPISIPPGVTQSIYIGFQPILANSRRARAFFQTNGSNFFGLDVDNGRVEGMLNFELVGTGIGPALANGVGEDELPKALVFPNTDVRGTSTMTGTIFNDGECDLLIDAEEFRIVAGDVDEFKILAGFTGIGRDAEGNYVLPPGIGTSFDVAFTPQRSGSRRASVQVVTNDSTVIIPGITERGYYYIDLFGVGKVGLEGRNVELPPAVIDGSSSTGVAVLENNSGTLVGITNIAIVGSGEIAEDPANPWPTTPVTVAPGQRFELGLILTPTPGSTAGIRTAVLEVTLDNGDVLSIDVTGLAGTRTLNIVPTSLFQTLRLPVGNLRRQFVVIANNGTLPVLIQDVQLGGTNPDHYSIGRLSRLFIEPGSAEFLEVTYAPTVAGPSSGTITILSNTTNGTPAGTHTITLGGEGTSTAIGGGEAGSAGTIRTPGDDQSAVRPSLGAAGASAMLVDGTALWQSTPNPTSGKAEIRYRLPADAAVTLMLYNANGKVVKTVLQEHVEAGENSVIIDLNDMPSGRYFYTLQTASGAVTLAMDLVK